MELSNAQRAQVLIHALPYIQKYTGKILVVKYGGNAMVNEELKQAVMGDLVLLSLIGVKVVLVHGGGPEISEMLKRVGKESQFVDGLRVTDKETADIVQMVLAGKLCKSLVSLLQSKGGKAIGLSGMDGYLIQAKPLRLELGYVGEITHINVEPVLDVLEKGYIPVISTVGCDAEGNVYNINADTAAARIAAELKAESLISMTDICGILRDKDDPSTLISQITVSEAPQLMREGVISGGMIPKVECCIEAIRRGVSRVFIIDGRIPHAILIEILTENSGHRSLLRHPSGDDSGRGRRAGTGQGLRTGAGPAGKRAQAAADGGRGSNRKRPHRQAVQLHALWHSAGRGDHRQGTGRRPAAGRGAAGRQGGRGTDPGQPRQHLRRQPGVLRRSHLHSGAAGRRAAGGGHRQGRMDSRSAGGRARRAQRERSRPDAGH